ncbi:MAG: DoxX family membrane protein [Flavobacteriaceae bacterium]|nr:DoxX family membrane protein [Flavobacteriaceae bacterium]MCY4253591.1 DoxX family membrane protein [Flavobacteriaceae bacterium]
MKSIAIIVIRILLAIIFVWAGIEKLFLPYNPSVFQSDYDMTNPIFFEFYDLLQNAGYLLFVGFFQLVCGVLLVLENRFYLLASIMLVPLLLCLLMTHVFFSKYLAFILFDSTLFLLNALVLAYRYSDWKNILLKPKKVSLNT